MPYGLPGANASRAIASMYAGRSSTEHGRFTTCLSIAATRLPIVHVGYSACTSAMAARRIACRSCRSGMTLKSGCPPRSTCAAASATDSTVARIFSSRASPHSFTAPGPASLPFASRVSSVACCFSFFSVAALGSCPCASRYWATSSSVRSTTCARRLDASSHSFGSTPRISRAFPSGRSPNLTPSVSDRTCSSARSYAVAMASLIGLKPFPSSARILPSLLVRTRFNTAACVWICGSFFRFVECGNAATISPSAAS